MVLSERIISRLEGFGNAKVQHHKGYSSSALWAEAEDYGRIDARLRKILKEFEPGGELINLQGQGEIIDQGEGSFSIEKGRTYEFYSYGEMSSLFLRLYLISDPKQGKRWVALYMDENPHTPWWAEERDEKVL